MISNPFLGLIFHWFGGLASASFYLPFRGVKKWAWETYWLVGGVFSWILAPWFFALLMTNDLFGVLREAQPSTLFWTFFFGLLWGTGGLTYGLTMRYLGISLGIAVALGFCAAFGTLVPPIYDALFVPQSPSLSQVFGTNSGMVILVGVIVCFTGIGVSGMAGMTKEREMTDEQKRAIIKEFNFRKGILVATFCGVMSACFSFGLHAGEPIKAITLSHGTAPLWQGLPVLVVLLLGGFTTNFIWCMLLNIKNKTGYQYLASHVHEEHAHHGGTGGSEHGGTAAVGGALTDLKIPAFANYLFSALAGTTWYFQFFFYQMGTTQMGRYDFASWTLHMASIIIFSTMWGWIFHEWKGSSKKAHLLIGGGISTLVLSTVVIGLGAAMNGGKSIHDIVGMLFGK